MKKSIIAIICFVSSFSLVVPAFAKETDYSYLEDMSVNELKELRAAIDKLLPPEEQKKDGKAASIELTKDNIETYLKFDGSFVDGTYTMGAIANWADAKLDFKTYPMSDGKFNNVEVTLVATSDDDAFTYMNAFGNYWHLEDAKDGEDKEIRFTVKIPFDGKFEKTYEVTCSNNTDELEGDCNFEIISASGEFIPNE